MILGEKIERKLYVNQQEFVSDIQFLIKHSFFLSFLHALLMTITKTIYMIRCYDCNSGVYMRLLVLGTLFAHDLLVSVARR